jgi:hypothetical protein
VCGLFVPTTSQWLNPEARVVSVPAALLGL